MSGKYNLNVPRTLEEACDPSNMALLVYEEVTGPIGGFGRGVRTSLPSYNSSLSSDVTPKESLIPLLIANHDAPGSSKPP